MIGTVATNGAEFHARALRSTSLNGPALVPGLGILPDTGDGRTIYDIPLYEQRVYEQVIATTTRSGRSAHTIRWLTGRPADGGTRLAAVVLRGPRTSDGFVPANSRESHTGGGLLCGIRLDNDTVIPGVTMGGHSAWGAVLTSCLRPSTKTVYLVNKRSVLYNHVTYLWRDAMYLGAMLDTVNITPDGVAIIPDNTGGFVLSRNAVLSAGCAYNAVTLKARYSSTHQTTAPAWHAGELTIASANCTAGFDHLAVVLSTLTNAAPRSAAPALIGRVAGVLLATMSWVSVSSFIAMICTATSIGEPLTPGRSLYAVGQILHANQACSTGQQFTAQWLRVPPVVEQRLVVPGDEPAPWLLADRWCTDGCAARGVLVEIIPIADQLALLANLSGIEVSVADQGAYGQDLPAVELWPTAVHATPQAGRQDTPVVIPTGELLCAVGMTAPAASAEVVFIFDPGLGLWRQQAVVSLTPGRLLCGAPQVELPADVLSPQVHFFTAVEAHGFTAPQVIKAALKCGHGAVLQSTLLAATTVLWSRATGSTQQEASAMMTALASCLTSTCAFPAVLLPDRIITIEKMPIFLCYDVRLDYDFEATTSPFDFSLIF